jgi:hypothetical protein
MQAKADNSACCMPAARNILDAFAVRGTVADPMYEKFWMNDGGH